MQVLSTKTAAYGRTAFLTVLLVLLCATCDQAGQKDGGGEPEPIDAGETKADAAGSGEAKGGAGSGETKAGAGSREASTERVEVSTLVTDLRVPWSFAFLPDGDALVTERDSGRLLRVSPSGEVREVQTLPEGGSGEGGLLGVAVSPDYEDDRYVYAYYTTERDNRVVRFRPGERPEPILTGIPVNTYHDGGRIKFGPDGMLYVSTGDAGDTG
jgi:glucose/arabinose dehydrogenase